MGSKRKIITGASGEVSWLQVSNEKEAKLEKIPSRSTPRYYNEDTIELAYLSVAK